MKASSVLILLPDLIAARSAALMRERLEGFELETSPAVDPDAVVDAARDAAYVCFGDVPSTAEMLERCAHVRLLQKWGAGMDRFDLEAAHRLGIAVANAPGANAVSVAEHFFALLLALNRRIVESHTGVVAGEWPQQHVVAGGLEDLHGKRLGLLGYGAIGREIAFRANAFGMEVVYHQRTKAETDLALIGLDELVASSDVVGLNVPLTPETTEILDRARIALMKRTAVLVNVSRGQVVEQDALIDAPRDGRIAGAALDVNSDEPLEKGHPLTLLGNVVLTPHVGGAGTGAQRNIARICAENILRVAGGKRPLYER